MTQLITLTTDFGFADPYVAEVKAIILGINPSVEIVDISHQIEKFNVRMGAYVLACAAPYFPKGTIHVAVIDPGVGTKRKPILIETKKGFFIGPDNGVLALAAEKQGIRHVYEIANPKYMLSKVSTTFHGRDIFAPAAAHLSKGVPPSEFGPEVQRIVKPQFAKIVRKGSTLVGEIIHVDGFGNIVTNLTVKELKLLGVRESLNIKIGEATCRLKLCRAYAEVGAKKPLAIIGSHDFLEISVNQGSAAEMFRAKVGDKVILYRS
ncbi:SAM-dependent chlorinase/fluorinase [Candidatus Bathyarchaeota archaeon]|nr:SAM-dependent chlorinase/fluorinase [Candidatus Bathyarchaeota archaeon]